MHIIDIEERLKKTKIWLLCTVLAVCVLPNVVSNSYASNGLSGILFVAYPSNTSQLQNHVTSDKPHYE